ncbi:MAG: C25 family cysteine peptidase [Candidatus Sumerlaeia bacterium]|nr:C25 family cysteine peptidase [Candidatus Sumerlaeia bacterium]
MRLSALAVLLAIAATADAQNFRKVPADQYQRGLRIEVVELLEEGFRFRVVNGNPPGALPESPVRLTGVFATPPEATVSISEPVGEWTFLPDRGGLEAGLALDAPASLATVNARSLTPTAQYLDEFRSVGLARLDIPVSPNAQPLPGATGRAPGNAVLDRAEYTVTWQRSGNRPPSETETAPDPLLAQVAADLLLNREQVEALRSGPAPWPDEERFAKWNQLWEGALRQGPVLVAKAATPGFTAVRPDDIRRAGLDPGRFDSTTTRAFLDGEELPLFVRDSADWTFGFHLPESEFARAPYRAVWLMASPPDSAHPPLRIAPSTGEAGTPLERATVSAKLFQPREFIPQLPAEVPHLRWATALLPQNRIRHFDLATPGALPDEPARLVLRFSQRNPQERSPLEVALNGVPVADELLENRKLHEVSIAIEPGLLRSGRPNELGLRLAGHRYEATPSTWAPADIPFIDARMEFRTTSDRIPPNQPFTPLAEGEAPLSLPGTGERIAARLDADGRATEWFHAESGPLHLGTPAGGSSVLWAAPADFASPAKVESPGAPVLFTMASSPESLVIAPAEFSGELQPLLDDRAARGGPAGFVAIEQIFREYSYGNVSYQAIRDLLRSLWQRSEGASLRSVLLVGEGSETIWELRGGTPEGTRRNWVPVWGWADTNATVRGDDSFATFVGQGPVADIEIGRLPVSDPAQIAGLIERHRRYREEPPPGDWRARHVLVADDDPEFARVADSIVRKTFDAPSTVERVFQQDMAWNPYPRIQFRRRSNEMTDRVVEALSAGAATVAYFGHGGPNVWTHERGLHLRDVPRINHGGREPMLFIASCDTAWVDYPTDPVATSLGELLVLTADSGAIGIWAPIAGTSSYEHDFLLTRAYEQYFRNDRRRLGYLTLLSKIGYLGDRRQPYVSNQYILLGDPELELVPPGAGIELAETSHALPALPGQTLSISGRSSRQDAGELTARLLDSSRRPITTFASLGAAGGEFSASLAVPGVPAPGRYWLQAELRFGDGAAEFGEASVEVQAPAATVLWAGEASERLATAGDSLELDVLVPNQPGTPGDEFMLEVLREADGELIDAAPLQRVVGDAFRLPVRIKVPAGRLDLLARIVRDDPDPTKRWVAAAAALRLIAEPEGLIAVDAATARQQRTANSPGATLGVDVRHLGEGALASANFQLSLDGMPEAVVQTDRAQLTGLQRGVAARISFPLLEPLPAGVHRATLRYRAQATGSDLTEGELPFEIEVPRGPDIRIVPESVRLDGGTPVDGCTVFLAAEVENAGDATAKAVRPVVRDRHQREVREHVTDAEWIAGKDLPPGRRMPFRIRYDVTFPENGREVVHLTAISRTAPLDLVNTADDLYPFEFEVARPADAAVSVEEAAVAPRIARQGDRIELRVPVHNTGGTSWPEPALAWRVEALDAEGTPRVAAEGALPPPAPGGSVELAAEWTVLPTDASAVLWVSPEREAPEAGIANNSFRIPVEFLRVWPRDGRLSARDAAEAGALQRLYLDGTGSLRVLTGTRDGEVKFSFDRAYSTEQDLADRTTATSSDGRYTMFDGILLADEGEDPAPLDLRFPVPAGFPPAGRVELLASGVIPGIKAPSGDFRFRLGAQGEWKTLTRTQPNFTKLGVAPIEEGTLVLTLAGPGYPSKTDFYHLLLYPHGGSATTPAYEGFPAGRLRPALVGEHPGGTGLRLEMRSGASVEGSVRWGEWLPLDWNTPFESPGPEFVQFRFSLAATVGEEPSLREVTFEPVP